ncbi:MAG: LysR family transcriptional regulator [Planctomycetes bacterium]|nr:LysR family transcriptional regulator [Planctomycetota bacterium]
MLAQIEALLALADTGSMTAAATRLRLTQPAVSKRIATLEAELGRELVDRSGRRVRLTAEGRAIVDELRPVVSSLKAALAGPTEAGTISAPRTRISIGVSESVLASWGAHSLRRAARAVPFVELDLHAHRSPAVVDHVRAGDYTMAIVAGQADLAPDLEVSPLLEEPMVLVPSQLETTSVPRRGPVPVMAIEEHSATWRSIRRRLAGHTWGRRLQVVRRLQSFVALTQLARAGFGHALVPEGVTRSLGIAEAKIVRSPRPELRRPISIIGTSGRLHRPAVAAFCRELRAVVGAGDQSPN